MKRKRFPSILAAALFLAVLPGAAFAEPAITVGIYLNKKDMFPQTGKVQLMKGKKYIVEARSNAPRDAEIAPNMRFYLDSAYGLETFEFNGAAVGNDFALPWTYDSKLGAYTARIVLSAMTMTEVGKADYIEATSPGMKDGSATFEIQPSSRPEIADWNNEDAIQPKDVSALSLPGTFVNVSIGSMRESLKKLLSRQPAPTTAAAQSSPVPASPVSTPVQIPALVQAALQNPGQPAFSATDSLPPTAQTSSPPPVYVPPRPPPEPIDPTDPEFDVEVEPQEEARP